MSDYRNIDYLMDYFQNDEEKARTYNRISNILWSQFGIQRAELTLLCAYCTLEYNKKYKMEDQNDGK